MIRLAYLIVAFPIPLTLLSQTPYFSFSPAARQAYQQVISLRFEEGRQTLELLKKTEPDNLMALHIEDYIDFFTVYIGESEQEFRKRAPNRDARLKIIAQGDRNSPYYLYLQANIRLHWALARLKFGEFFTAFLEVRKAFRLLTRNEQLFPDFLPNKKDLGILHAMVGTIPNNYKWGVELLGMSGTIQEGEQELRHVLEKSRSQPFIYDLETLVLYTYLQLHLNNNLDEAWELLRNTRPAAQDNPLLTFVLANVAMRTGRNDHAIELLNACPRGNEFYPMPYLDLMMGDCQLRRLSEKAAIYYHLFLERFKGKHFIKDAYRKLAWHGLLFQGPEQYQYYMNEVKFSGTLVVESDKEAEKEADSGQTPEILLLKARLLFDGGYYQRALDTLTTTLASRTLKHQLEYLYRMGRIHHKLGNFDLALQFYQQTIHSGMDKPAYFACNAAVQSGLIWEESGDHLEAVNFFRMALIMDPKDHRAGLHQQAKAGLNRNQEKLNNQ